MKGLVCCWCPDTSLFLFSLLSDMSTRKPKPKKRHFYHLDISPARVALILLIRGFFVDNGHSPIPTLKCSQKSCKSNFNLLSI